MKLDPLAAMLHHPGPYATVLADASRVQEDALYRIERRHREIRARLTGLGAPPEVIDTVAEPILEPTGVPGAVGRLAVATTDGLVADEVVPRWSGEEVVAWEALPAVTEWLAFLDSSIPVLVVLADRVGAELRRYEAASWAPEQITTVDGQTLHLSKVPDGGMSLAQLQNRTEEVWRRNARGVAAQLDTLADPDILVVLAGDERARHEILEAWSPPAPTRVVQAGHGARAPGASEQTLEAEVRAAIRETVAEQHLQSLRDLEERRGREHGVAEGMSAVLGALVAGQSARVFLHGPDAARTAVRPADHPGLPLPASVPADRPLPGDLVVLAAAAGTGAEAIFVEPTAVPRDGVAAALRWDNT